MLMVPRSSRLWSVRYAYLCCALVKALLLIFIICEHIHR